MPGPTLRTRATLLATAITAVALLAGSVLLVLTLQSQLTSNGDELARSRVRDLLEQAASGNLPARLTNLDDNGVAQVVDDRGRVLAATPNITGRPPIAAIEPGSELVGRTVDAPDDQETERYRLWAGSGTGTSGRVTVYVGTSLEAVSEATHTLRRSLAIGVPVLLLLLATGTWRVLGGALRRVDRLRTEVDTITDDHLDRRVPTSDLDDEVGRLAVTMNRMLDRLESSRARQRAFVADISHDLQSPLATQRAQLEIALAHPESADPGSLVRELLAGTAEMEHLVRDLLFLAAADAGSPSPTPALVDLDDIVLEEAARARTGSAVRIDTSAVSAAPVLGDRTELRRLVRNLVDNALTHAASTVELRLETDADTVRLEVSDDGPGVPDAERTHIFDRFHRGDSARTRHTGGLGLGLAIARTIADRAGGELVLAPGHGSRFVLRLPSGERG